MACSHSRIECRILNFTLNHVAIHEKYSFVDLIVGVKVLSHMDVFYFLFLFNFENFRISQLFLPPNA